MKRLICIILYLVFTQLVIAQSISRDSLEKVITPLVKKEVDAKLGGLQWALGISVAGLTVLGIYLWVWKIKQTSEKIIKEKVDALIENKLADKIGVKLELVKSYFKEIEEAQAIKQKRILVISKTCGKRDTIVKAIEKAGFSTIPIFKTLSEYSAGIDTNHFDLILFDNEDGTLEETEMTAIVDEHEQALKFVCFSTVDVSSAIFKAYNKKVRFIKDIINMDFALTNALKS